MISCTLSLIKIHETKRRGDITKTQKQLCLLCCIYDYVISASKDPCTSSHICIPDKFLVHKNSPSNE